MTNTPPVARSPVCVSLHLEPHCARLLLEQFAPACLEPVLAGVARSIAGSPAWTPAPPLGVTVRALPEPVLGFFGNWSEEELRLIRLHAATVPGTLERLRVLGYPQVEEVAQALARGVAEALGAALPEARFVAIPRGGHVVLAYLSYLLDLSPEQLLPGDPSDRRPLVVVDDCAFTGARFAQFVAQPATEGGGPLVFAHLLSPAPLRAALLAGEPRLTACIAGQDLTDRGPDRLGDQYPAWQARCLERAGPRRYWVGLVEHVCFPWSEPGRTLWDEVTQRTLPGWRLVPASHCLARRGDRGLPPVQMQPASRGPLSVADDVLWCDLSEEVLVAAGERVLALRDVAAGMWRAVVQAGDRGGALQTLAAHYPDAGSALEADLHCFTADLVGRGVLLERAGAGQ